MAIAFSTGAAQLQSSGRASHDRAIVSIQYLRGAAALMVIIYHLLERVLVWKGPEPAFMYAFSSGADIFFVISGFVIWRSSAKRALAPGDFLLARAWRIAPLYWIALSSYLLFLLLAHGLRGAPPAVEILKAFAFIPYIDSLTGLNAPFLVVGWTLNYEMFFYLIFAACLTFDRLGLRFAAMIGALVALVAARVFLNPNDPAVFRFTSPLLFEFAAGMALSAGVNAMGSLSARLNANAQRRLERAAFATGLGAVALAGCLFLAVGHLRAHGVARAVHFGAPAVALVAGAVLLEPFLARLRLAVLESVGDASYSLYLFHPIACDLCTYALPRGPSHPLLVFGVLMSVSLAAGFGGHFFLERPLMAFPFPDLVARTRARLAGAR